ncbi:orotidine-5'-phosphate decarboxylase [Thiomicrorhabdus lithotrophica]|uniref:Orotidine 5'-phosphate decarboxylase n=1 Tax=Thiomicrorhabdus lithotrophica TaxID=2949997 RepID=A0ABY8CGV9_9GAMM|nr:orotidine-5'-phosphate decarboxylase [Thiomicrorhabdus lithotrophica]WEJ63721.1 orotidine-5'-phosphate decarboxylase [Thiomicrorhabdus lithotrophica]
MSTNTLFDVNDPKVLVALDFANSNDALEFVKTLNSSACRLKVGKELFAVAGPNFVKDLVKQGFDVFLDLKYHDIPNTVAKAVQAAARMGVWMVNVHALGGRKMMQAAKLALDELADVERKPLLIAVTVLTSMEQEDLAEIGLQGTPEDNVLRLASLAQSSGLDGVVCSAQEAAPLRKLVGSDFCLVTPGIRPSGSAVNDQKRIMTPVEAMTAGSSYLVVGRPITQSAEPLAVLEQINQSLAGY